MKRLRKALIAVLITFGLLATLLTPAGAQETALSVTIKSPPEGAMLYAGPEVPRYALPISGQVSPVSSNVSQVTLRMDILQGGKVISSLTGHPGSDGSFRFMVTVNPEAPIMPIPSDKKQCATCHDQITQANLPSGKSSLVLTATDPSGRQATAQCHIIVDRGGWANVLVQVAPINNSVEPVQGLPIIATTHFQIFHVTMLETISRYFKGFTDASGNVWLRIEALAESPTDYVAYIPATVISGTLISSPGSAHFSLPPDARTAPAIRLEAKGVRGQIAGRLLMPSGGSPAAFTVYAIERPSGRAYTAESSDGAYALSDLPISGYLVGLDEHQLATHGLSANSQPVDVTGSKIAHVDLMLKALPAPNTRGVVQTDTGKPLPFAWVVDENSGQTARVDLINGEFSLPAAKAGGRTLSILAPGYWSLAQVVETQAESASPRAFTLKERPDTRQIVLSDEGQITVPAVTVASASNENLSLSQGWVWGTTSNKSYAIDLPEASIVVGAGSHFALERRLGQTPWLYVLSGKAEATLAGQNSTLSVGPSQMLALTATTSLPPAAGPLEPVVFNLLHAGESNPLAFESEPTLGARIHDWLAQAGISVAQGSALVAYSAVVLAIISAPLLVLLWWLHTRRSTGSREPKSGGTN
jgi:hypothetical protein